MAEIRAEPLPNLPSARVYTEGLRAGELRFQRCLACGVGHHPPAASCPACGSTEHEVVASAGRGRIASWMIPRRPALPAPAAAGRTIVLVALDEGVEVLGHYEGASTPDFDERVAARIGAFADLPIPIFRKYTDAEA